MTHSLPDIDVTPEQWGIISSILKRNIPGTEVWAFGSRATWTAKPFSDLDLAIIGSHPLPLAATAAMAEEFSESDLPWKVDLVDWASTSESFRNIIANHKVVIQSPGVG